MSEYASQLDHPDLNGVDPALIVVRAKAPSRALALPDDPPTEDAFVPPTPHGAEVLEVTRGAVEWAKTERHGVVRLRTLLFALAKNARGANALAEAGVRDIKGLEHELLGQVHFSPVPPLAEGQAPRIESCVLAVLHASACHARLNGRDETSLDDVMAALEAQFRAGRLGDADAGPLITRWPRLVAPDEKLVILQEIKTMLAKTNVGAAALKDGPDQLAHRVSLLEEKGRRAWRIKALAVAAVVVGAAWLTVLFH